MTKTKNAGTAQADGTADAAGTADADDTAADTAAKQRAWAEMYMTEHADKVGRAIVDLLRSRTVVGKIGVKGSDVVELLEGRGYDELAIKSAMWELADKGILDFTNDWRLRIPENGLGTGVGGFY